MEHLVESLADLVQRHLFWAGPILGLLTFGEALVVIGAFFPATVMMLVAGTLTGAGVLHPGPVLLWCLAGAVAGDAVSYFIGRAIGPRAWRYDALKPHRRVMARARLFFRKHGILSIFVCRFLGPVQAFVPLIAGVTNMSQVRFQAANVGSALIWVPVMLAPGYLAAKGLELLSSQDLERVYAAAAVLAVSGLIFLGLNARPSPAGLPVDQDAERSVT